MQGDATVIQHLNAVLRNEMTAVNQYFLHARMLDHWGAVKLGAHEYDESIGEMKHADRVIERLLFLDGLPRLELGNLHCAGNLRMRSASRAGGNTAASLGDRPLRKRARLVTRDLSATILEGEEEHVETLETHLGLLAKIGLENYIQLQSGPAS